MHCEPHLRLGSSMDANSVQASESLPGPGFRDRLRHGACPMDARLPWLTIACLLVGTLASSAQRARTAPPFRAPEPGFIAPRLLADLTEGSPNHGVEAAGDLDNDGDVDLLAFHYPNLYTSDAIQSWRNDGQGHFALVNSMPYSPGGNPPARRRHGGWRARLRSSPQLRHRGRAGLSRTR